MTDIQYRTATQTIGLELRRIVAILTNDRNDVTFLAFPKLYNRYRGFIWSIILTTSS